MTPETSSPAEKLAHYDHHSVGRVQDSYDLYDDAIAQCPVSHSDALGGFWMITDYQGVRAAAKAWEAFSSADGVFLPRLDVRFPIIDQDPPDSTWWRNTIKNELSVSGTRKHEDGLRAATIRLIEAFQGEGEVDLVEVLCEPLPVMAVCQLLGVDDDRVPAVRPIAMDLFAAMGDPSLFMDAFNRFGVFATQEIELRRANPRDDLLTRLCTQEWEGRKLPDDGLLVFLVGLLTAGHHTTTSAMASTFLHVLGDTTLRDRVIADPRLVRTATEEAIRLKTPLHMQFRQSTEDKEVSGTTIPAGCPVGLNFAAANRDPSVFDEPHEFRLDRTPNPHVGFGFGPHTCLGAPLSRLEINLALSEVLQRLPDMELAVDPASLEYEFVGGNLALIEKLPVKFTPVGA
jgi:cytochrome P450